MCARRSYVLRLPAGPAWCRGKCILSSEDTCTDPYTCKAELKSRSNATEEGSKDQTNKTGGVATQRDKFNAIPHLKELARWELFLSLRPQTSFF